MNDEIHAAARVRKTRSSGINAFTSPNFGSLGYVEEGCAVFGNRPARWSGIPERPDAPTPRVALLETYLGDDGTVLNLLADAGLDGIVVGGFGVGHASPGLADAVERAARSCPVVLATRTGSGTGY